MWRAARQMFHELASGPPGQRFERYYRHRRSSRGEHPLASGLYVALGLLVVLFGLLLSIPPGVPGFLVTLVGLGILVARLPMVARALDRLELLMRRLLGRDRRGDQR